MRVKGHPFFLAIIFIAALCLGVFFAREHFNSSYDLMRHGQFTTGTVKAVKEKQGIRHHKYSSDHYIYYENTIEYAGTSRNFSTDKPMTVGQRTEIYYSSADPRNADFRRQEHPYKSVKDIIFSQNMLIFLAFSVSMLLAAVYYLWRWLTKSGRYYEGY